MKVRPAIPKHHIVDLLKQRQIGAAELADMIGVSKSYMSKLINKKAPVTTALGLRIGDALGVDPHKVVDLKFGNKLKKLEDEGLLGEALTWLLEVAARHKVVLAHAEVSHWATYVYKSALAEKLNLQQTRLLATTIIEVLRRAKA